MDWLDVNNINHNLTLLGSFEPGATVATALRDSPPRYPILFILIIYNSLLFN